MMANSNLSNSDKTLAMAVMVIAIYVVLFKYLHRSNCHSAHQSDVSYIKFTGASENEAPAFLFGC